MRNLKIVFCLIMLIATLSLNLSCLTQRHYGLNNIYIVSVDEGNATLISNQVKRAAYSNVSLSPDGDKLVFTRTNGLQDDNHMWDMSKIEIYKMNMDGTNLIELTNNSVEESDVCWSPIGNKIAYVVIENIWRLYT